MYRFILNLFGYEQYKILDMERIHKYGKAFGGCSVYTGTKEEWDSTKELAYRRGRENKDHSGSVVYGTPLMRVIHNGHLLIEAEVFHTGIRKKK